MWISILGRNRWDRSLTDVVADRMRFILTIIVGVVLTLLLATSLLLVPIASGQTVSIQPLPREEHPASSHYLTQPFFTRLHVQEVTDTTTDTSIATVTAYSARETCPGGDADYCITASGSKPRAGRSVACPRRVPFGTRVQIQGQGFLLCEDRTALRFDGRYDIYMDDYEEAKRFGRRRLEVGVIR